MERQATEGCHKVGNKNSRMWYSAQPQDDLAFCKLHDSTLSVNLCREIECDWAKWRERLQRSIGSPYR